MRLEHGVTRMPMFEITAAGDGKPGSLLWLGVYQRLGA